MYYSDKIQKIRDDIQREIISTAVSTVTIFDGILEFNNPVEVVLVEDTIYTRVELFGIDISTGRLVDVHDDIVPFKSITVESLNDIHEVLVIKKSFTFKPDLFV